MTVTSHSLRGFTCTGQLQWVGPLFLLVSDTEEYKMIIKFNSEEQTLDNFYFLKPLSSQWERKLHLATLTLTHLNLRNLSF